MGHRFIVPVLAAMLLSGSCRSKSRTKIQATEEEAPQLASMVHVADPRVAAQLVSGFYPVEDKAWRWTAGKFAVMLRPPRTAAEKGAVLQLKFAVPDPVISKLKTLSVTAAINGTSLPPETYNQAGEFTYARDVPPKVLGTEPVKVEFALDKALPPSAQDQRELGVVVSAVGFEPK
jgi:hypothetical protein